MSTPSQIAVSAFARNVVAMLQQDPQRYKTFGIWWWPLKIILKRYHDSKELYLLGPCQDPSAAEQLGNPGLQETIRAAIEEHQNNMTLGQIDGHVFGPDGEPYEIYDPDAGF